MNTTSYLTAMALLCALPACTDRKTTAAVPATEAVPACCGGTVYEVPEVDAAPSFPGGDAALYAWVGNKLAVPPGTAEGTAWVEFNIECDGSLHGIRVKRPASPELDSAAVQLVRAMPRWQPGTQKDKPVCVQYLLPVKHGSQ